MGLESSSESPMELRDETEIKSQPAPITVEVRRVDQPADQARIAELKASLNSLEPAAPAVSSSPEVIDITHLP